MPAHTHSAIASSAAASTANPSNSFWATGVAQYASSPVNTAMASNAIALNGTGQGHENRSPYLVLNFIIALNGIFPPRN